MTNPPIPSPSTSLLADSYGFYNAQPRVKGSTNRGTPNRPYKSISEANLNEHNTNNLFNDFEDYITNVINSENQQRRVFKIVSTNTIARMKADARQKVIDVFESFGNRENVTAKYDPRENNKLVIECHVTTPGSWCCSGTKTAEVKEIYLSFEKQKTYNSDNYGSPTSASSSEEGGMLIQLGFNSCY